MIWLNGSSLSILYGFFTRGPDKKHDDLISTALLEALAWQFIYFGENDCACATSKGAGSEARGEGRERGNLPVTTTKSPVAQGAGGIIGDFAQTVAAN